MLTPSIIVTVMRIDALGRRRAARGRRVRGTLLAVDVSACGHERCTCNVHHSRQHQAADRVIDSTVWAGEPLLWLSRT